MSFFKNETKKRCGKFVAIVSLLLMAMGLFAGLYGYFGVDTKSTWTLGEKTYPSPVALFGLLAIVAGAFALITGSLGLCAAKYKNCCFTVPFMILTLTITVFMLAVALVALAG